MPFSTFIIKLPEEIEHERKESVTRRGFNELREIPHELAECLNELAKTQKRTEEGLAKPVRALKKPGSSLVDLLIRGYVLKDRAYKGLPDSWRL